MPNIPLQQGTLNQDAPWIPLFGLSRYRALKGLGRRNFGVFFGARKVLGFSCLSGTISLGLFWLFEVKIRLISQKISKTGEHIQNPMNVTRLNFTQTLPFILDCIKKSHFIAFDFEMTGVVAADYLRNSNLDSVFMFPNVISTIDLIFPSFQIQLRYWKSKENIRQFLPTQLGLCCFKINSLDQIEAAPFNFYMFPLSLEGFLDRKFLSQVGFPSFSSGSLMNSPFLFSRPRFSSWRTTTSISIKWCMRE